MRDSIRAYNTCAGYAYNSGGTRRTIAGVDKAAGPYDDQIAFMRDAGALAESLLSEGYTAMKIWPFDGYAACEMHSLWTSHAAIRICRALEDVGVFWAEDAIAKMDDAKALADLRRQTRTPICGSETLAGSVPYRDLLAADALDVVMLDLAWCGGLTAGRKIAALAESYARPLAPHDCTGPVTLMAGLHLAIHAPTAIFQEVVRATLSTWYRDLVTELPVVKAGMVLAPTGSGLGTKLNPAVRQREDVSVRTTGKPR
jgi:L-alanine-DL-glutamate epimerase-like enolase superfamily enzyme